MPKTKPPTTAEFIAQLNADLKRRDPFEVMKRQIRDRTIDEFLARLLTAKDGVKEDGTLPQAAWDIISKVATRMKDE